MDMKMQQQFFTHLFTQALAKNQIIEIREIFNDSGKVSQYWCPDLDSFLCKTIKLTSNNSSVYFGVALRSRKDGSSESVKYLKCLWCDIDYGTAGHKKTNCYPARRDALRAIARFPLRPTYIVDSGYGFHLYWLLKELVDVTDIQFKVESILTGLAQELSGDTSVATISSILRVPGTYNKKITDEHKLVSMSELKPNDEYKLSDFDSYAVAGEKLKLACNFNVPVERAGSLYDTGCMISYLKSLGATRIKANKGGWINLSCLLATHEGADTHPSAGINTKLGIYKCFAEDITIPIDQFFENMGQKIEIEQDYGDIFPSGLLTALQQGDPELLGYETYTPVDPVGIDIEIVEELTQELGYVIKSQYNREPEVIKGLIANGRDIFRTFVRQDKDIVTISAHPGGYKSWDKRSFIVKSVLKNPYYSCIFVNEKQIDVEKDIDSINRAVGRKVAYAVLGYSKDMCIANCYQECKFNYNCKNCSHRDGYKEYTHEHCKNCEASMCRVKRNYAEAKKHRVIGITSQRLAQFGISSGLETCYDESLREYYRSDLIIDEAPHLLDIRELTFAEIESFIDICVKQNLRFRKLNVLQQFLSMTGNLSKNVAMRPLDSTFKTSGYFKKKFIQLLPDIYPVLEKVDCLIRSGGTFNQRNNSIFTYKMLDLEKLHFRTTILDGSSIIDPRYKVLKTKFLKLSYRPSYENVTLTVANSRNLSKTALADAGNFDVWAKTIIEFIKGIEGKVYIATFLDNEKDIMDMLVKHNLTEKCILKHYGATRGSNEMLDCKNIILFGNFRKPEEAYCAMARGIHGDSDLKYEICLDDKIRRFMDTKIELVKLMDFAQEFYQEIHRIGIRKFNRDFYNIYLFNRDEAFIKVIEAILPGIRVRYEQILNRHLPALISVLNEFMVSGRDYISKAEILDKIGLKKSQILANLFNNAVIISYVRRHGLSLCTHKLMRSGCFGRIAI